MKTSGSSLCPRPEGMRTRWNKPPGTLTTAHLAPTLVLAALSGILLSRARGRDRAGQRAGDLAVALGTMFVYSGQIQDEAERQRFIHEMGRVVIESYLHQDTPTSDDG